MPARLLLTGFVPFGPHTVNPSERVLRRLAESPPAGVVLSTRVLPVAYRLAFVPVQQALDTERFDAALLMGLGAGRAAVGFERLAVNWRGSTRPDNEGRLVAGEKIDPAGPAAYFATVPVDELASACHAAGTPGSPSRDIGTYLCNQVLYQTLRHCDRRGVSCRTGFAHLPLLPEQAGEDDPHMEEDAMVSGLRAALAVLAALPPSEAPPEPGSGEPARP